MITALRIQPGDRIGLVGRNGAGKTTTLRILAGETEPYAGSVTRTGEVGYLPQDPKEGDLEVLARDRVLSARGLDVLLTDLEKQRALMAEVADDDARDRLAHNIIGHVSKGVKEPVLSRVFDYWSNVDPDLGKKVEEGVRAKLGQ